MTRSDAFDLAFKVFSYFLCICCAIYFTVQCIQHFMLDEDVTKIEYRKFHEDTEAIYPSITYCIKNPVVSKDNDLIWKKYGDKDPKELRNDYIKYLSGLESSDVFSEKDYDIITKQLETFVEEVVIAFDSNTFVTWKLENKSLILTDAYRKYATEKNQNTEGHEEVEYLTNEEKQKIASPKFYITQRSTKEKCYTFDVPYIENVRVDSFHLHLDPYELFNINKEKNKKMINPQEYQSYFRMYFHYPNQKLLALSKRSILQSAIDSSLQYNRQHFLKNIEVLRRRNKRSQPCITEKEYDKIIIEETIESFGCKLPNIDEKNNASICMGRAISSKFYNAISKKQHRPPCQGIQAINIQDKEFERSVGMKNDEKKISKVPRKLVQRIYFEDSYFKEMIYIKDYTFLSLFANAGGYIGKESKTYFSISNS